MKLKNLFLLIPILIGPLACIEETVQLENISKDIEIERQIALPLVKGDLVIGDLVEGEADSSIFTNGDTIYFYTVDDISLQDTVEFGGIGINMDFDFLNIYHTITNMIPIDLDLNLYLYDQLIGSNIDTIFFNTIPGEYLINAPPVDNDGLVIEDAVETRYDAIELDAATLDNLLNRTSHLIILARVPSTGTVIKILKHYNLEFALGLSARGRYVTSLDSII